MSTDRLAEEMDRRADSINLQTDTVPAYVEDALRVIRTFAKGRKQTQSLRHSSIHFVSTEIALVEWD